MLGPARGCSGCSGCGSHLRRGARSHPASPPSSLGAGQGCSPPRSPGSPCVPAALKSKLWLPVFAPRLPVHDYGKASARIPLFSRLKRKAKRLPALLMPGNREVPRAELGRRSLRSDVGRTRPLCHPDNYSTMQHPLHLSHFSFPLATACPLASVL